MSLYNQLHGVNEIAQALLEILKITKEDCGRFRDAHLLLNNTIRILTRNGYPEYDHLLIKHDYYLMHYNEPSDKTFVTYIFAVPEEYKTDILNDLYKSQKDTMGFKEKTDSYLEALLKGEAPIPQSIINMFKQIQNNPNKKVFGLFDSDFKNTKR